jgi:hypothetical protein
MHSPITVHPHKAFCGHRRPYFIADWWRRNPNVYLHLAKCRGCEDGCDSDAA